MPDIQNQSLCFGIVESFCFSFLQAFQILFQVYELSHHGRKTEPGQALLCCLVVTERCTAGSGEMGSEGNTGVSAGHQHSFCPLRDRGVGWEIPVAKASDGPCVGISSSVFQPFPMQCSSQRSECSPCAPACPGRPQGAQAVC